MSIAGVGVRPYVLGYPAKARGLPHTLEDMVHLPQTTPVRSNLLTRPGCKRRRSIHQSHCFRPRHWDSWSQCSTRTVTPGLSESDLDPASTSAPAASKRLVIASSPPKRTLSTSSMRIVASERKAKVGVLLRQTERVALRTGTVEVLALSLPRIGERPGYSWPAWSSPACYTRPEELGRDGTV